jgi:Tfp pilus assembly protein PilF
MSERTYSATEYFDFGVEAMERDDWALATQMFRAAVQCDPNLVQAHAGLGAALGNQGLWSLAVEAHSRALELEPTDVDTIYNLGVAYGELGRPIESADYFRRVLDVRPGDRETMVRLGTELAEQERFLEAVEYFQTVALAPGDSSFTATAWACAGASLIRLGRVDEARLALERAKSLEPALFEHRQEFAQLLAEVGGV